MNETSARTSDEHHEYEYDTTPREFGGRPGCRVCGRESRHPVHRTSKDRVSDGDLATLIKGFEGLLALRDTEDDNILAALRELRDRRSDETGVVYRKWPGEPPHCMSCDCGMTDEQKRTVPFEDYQTFHTALMAIVYESKSFTEAVKLASDALSHKPPAEKALEQPSCEVHMLQCSRCSTTAATPIVGNQVSLEPFDGWSFATTRGWRCPKCDEASENGGTSPSPR